MLSMSLIPRSRQVIDALCAAETLAVCQFCHYGCGLVMRRLLGVPGAVTMMDATLSAGE
jgi:hypothetical protein